MRALVVGDPVRFDERNGSIGRIVQANGYGGFYVEWHYGRDIGGAAMTSLASVRKEQLVLCSEEEFRVRDEREGFGAAVKP